MQSTASPSKKRHVQLDEMEDPEEPDSEVISALLEMHPSLGPFEELTARQVAVVTALRYNILQNVETTMTKLSGQDKAAMIQMLRQEQDLEEELKPEKVPSRTLDLEKQVCAKRLLDETEASQDGGEKPRLLPTAKKRPWETKAKTVGVLQLMLRTEQSSVNIPRTLSQTQSSTGAARAGPPRAPPGWPSDNDHRRKLSQ